ncbi:O-antigen/teichoic acid export membrane protein [Cytobacillus eiseniae]|uniref:O-antigen/teichoic acid export membrane protein n=1 Tax=Cytobacillus eiseniae TaxID=762947 RepID=A0ABS4RGH7_9BACI|nr:polysaccharide biosynthesis protein [Cytobacillus eiseniae]MBP2241470.1 O-antigen/teichoic acid export membrane protein [Cytobacillus eiseniae]
MSSKLLRGTFILTLGTIISKVLGLFYVIPFYHIVGQEGNALYSFAYIPYTIFISLATAGIPAAISKFISKYNALEEYAVGRKLFKSGMFVMMCSGILAFLTLYSLAPFIAEISPNDANVTIEDGTTVIRAVSFALLLVPFMSMIRGFFQGHQSMGPTAVSQVIEQIVRIFFVLVGAYVVLNFMNGSMSQAVSVATFAAFIGAIGGLCTLLWYWYKRKPHLDELLLEDKGTVDISLRDMYKEIIVYAAPFVFVGIANPLFQLIDQLTFSGAMESIGLAGEAVTAFAILNFNTHKLVIIPVSLATAFSLTLVPSITSAFVDGDRKNLNMQLNQAFQVLLFLTLPAVVGLSLLAEPIFTLFYDHDPLGTDVLRIYAPVAILFAYFLVTAAILQGINEQRFTVLSLLVGLLIKLSLNIPLIKLMETQGAVVATAIGYIAAITINLLVIKKFAHYPFKLVVRRGLLIILFTLFMFIGAGITYKILTLFLSPATDFQAFILVIICAAVGASIYFYLSFKTRLVYFLFGEKVDRWMKKLRLRV